MIFVPRLSACCTGALFLFVPLSAAQNAASPPASPQSSSAVITCPANLAAPPLSAPLAAAQQLYRTGKFDEALRAYTVIAAAGGAEGAAAYAGMARTYLSKKDVPDALDAANRAVALTPGKGPAIVAMGEVDYRLAKFSLAEDAFLTSIRNCEADARAHLGMAGIALATSNRLRAKQEIDRARALDPHDPDIELLWIFFLPLAERERHLRERLDEQANDDADVRRILQEHLAILQDETDHPNRAHSCRIVQPRDSTTTKLIPLMESAYYLWGYGLEVRVNGTGARLLLDTGAGGISINRRVAEKAGIKPVVRTEINGIGDKGGSSAYIGIADSIKIGDLEFQGCPVEVSEKKILSDSDGLIGGSIFSDYLLEIDFPDAKINLSPLPLIPNTPNPEPSLHANLWTTTNLHDRYIAPSMSDYTRVYEFDADLLIPTRVNDGPQPRLFLIDTGAFDNTISPDVAKQSTRVDKDYATTVEGSSGAVKRVYRAETVDLAFSRFHQKHDDMVSFDMTKISDSIGTEVSGILGFNMLRMLDIKIDYRDGLVDFQYDRMRLH